MLAPRLDASSGARRSAAKSSARSSPAARRSELPRTSTADIDTSVPADPPSRPEKPVVGRIDIPRIGLSASVREGDDEETLRIAVGHISGTPLPGIGGNAGLAAHRNTFFRPLRDVRKDDRIVVTTGTGAFHYRVESTEIVLPTDVRVLDPTEQPALTLVTCYPFDWIGDAPQRFIVHAVRVEEAESALPPRS